VVVVVVVVDDVENASTRVIRGESHRTNMVIDSKSMVDERLRDMV
jgi:hypothetical protein